MSTECWGKDWLIEPTYAEVVAFSRQPRFQLLVKGKASFDYSLNWARVCQCVYDIGPGWTDWESILAKLEDNYSYLWECPDCIQDWFKHLYDLTILLEE
jgi:hypothetical protein